MHESAKGGEGHETILIRLQSSQWYSVEESLVLPRGDFGQRSVGIACKDIIRLATGLLVTMTALVLGMLVSSANSSYQDRKNELAEMASDFLVLDQVLATYGPETQVIRDELRRLAENSLERIWASQASRRSQLRPGDQRPRAVPPITDPRAQE